MNRLEARQVRRVVIGAAGVANQDYVVPVGSALIITNAEGQHNDVAARVSGWSINFNDGMGFRDVAQPQTLAPYGRFEFYTATIAAWTQPLVLRAGMTLRFYVTGLVGAAIASMEIIVDEYVGENPYAG